MKNCYAFKVGIYNSVIPHHNNIVPISTLLICRCKNIIMMYCITDSEIHSHTVCILLNLKYSIYNK